MKEDLNNRMRFLPFTAREDSKPSDNPLASLLGHRVYDGQGK